MKNNYFVTLCAIVLFTVSSAFSQSCPPTGFTDGTALYFFYDPGTSLCVDRPTTVTVGASSFDLTSCGDEFSVYDLTSGSAIVGTNFTADFGFGTCEYTNGVLTNQTLFVADKFLLNKDLKIFPNPIITGNILNIDFGQSIEANIEVYSITGKLVLIDTVNKLNKMKLNISTLTNGVYMIRISSKTTSVNRKFVVMK